MTAPGVSRLVPGIALAAALAAAAFALRELPFLSQASPLILAILLGMLFHNLVGTPAAARAGIAACMRRPLRAGIVLLGLQLTLAQVAALGGAAIGILVLCVVATFAATVAAGRWLGVDPRLAKLIAAGTSICGASAIMAANTVVRDRDEGVAYALGIVTLFGTIVMLGFPLAGEALALSMTQYGLWIGAAVHEVPQVVAAAFALGQEGGEYGTVAKLARVLLLAPMVLALGWWAVRRSGGGSSASPPTPWFVFGFLAMVALASTGWIAAEVTAASKWVTQGLLALALAAVGTQTDFRHIRERGWRPLALGALATVFIAALSLGLVLALLPR